MALFSLLDGMTLEIHIPTALAIHGGRSTASEAGFILRRDQELVNVGPLGHMLRK